MNKIIIYLLKKAKKFIDNLYYNKYHLNNEEPLIRKMFPWISHVGDYNAVNDYLKNQAPSDLEDLKKLILSFYWWEVSNATTSRNFDYVKSLHCLVDFAESLSAYHSEILISNNTENVDTN